MALESNNLESLPEEIKSLLVEAQLVAKNAYNRYSGFFVGAAVLSDTGVCYKGTFMENASYGATICAEPAAILSANSNGDLNIRSIAVVGGDGSGDGKPVTPCGKCRQIIFEASMVSGNDIDIYCSDLNLNKVIITTIKELYPHPFKR